MLRNLYLSYGTYPCVTELILVFQILYLFYGAYTCLTDLILVFRILYLYYRSYVCIMRLSLIVQNLYLYYRYGSTRKYYRDFTCTKVLIGTTEHILIQRYP